MKKYLFRMTVQRSGEKKQKPRVIEEEMSISSEFKEEEADELARRQACKIWERTRKSLRLKNGIIPETESELFKKIPFP